MHERDAEAASRTELARRFFSRVAAGDLDGMLEMVAPDAQLTPLAAPGRVYSGRDGLRRFLTELQTEGVAASISPHRFDEVGGRIVVTGSLRRRSRREIAERTAAWVLRFDDRGRLTCIDAFGTRLEAYRALALRSED